MVTLFFKENMRFELKKNIQLIKLDAPCSKTWTLSLPSELNSPCSDLKKQQFLSTKIPSAKEVFSHQEYMAFLSGLVYFHFLIKSVKIVFFFLTDVSVNLRQFHWDSVSTDSSVLFQKDLTFRKVKKSVCDY